MSDLIERLEEWHDSPNDLYSNQKAKLREAIAALREQDKALKACLWHSEEDDKEITHLQARITELEAALNDNGQGAISPRVQYWHDRFVNAQARIAELDELRQHFEVKFSEQCQINFTQSWKMSQLWLAWENGRCQLETAQAKIEELRQELKRAEHRIDTLCTTISDRHKRIRELEQNNLDLIAARQARY